MLVFWDVDGNKIVEDEERDAGENLCGSSAGDIASITEALEKALGSKPEALHTVGDKDSEHNVLDAVYPDGTRHRVKIFRDKSLSARARHRRAAATLARECAALAWMSTSLRCAGLVPKVLVRHDARSTSGAPSFLVTPYPPGSPLYGHFGALSEQHKSANLRSYSGLVRALFRVPCPRYIGSVVSCSAADDVAQLGPCVHPFDGTRAPAVFERIDDYFGWLLHKKRARLVGAQAPGGTPRLSADARRVLRAMRRLEGYIAQDIRALDEPLLRCVPALEDMGPRNVWITAEGHVSGVADWGALVVKPAVLAADYPEWLDYPDAEHPALNAKSGRYMEQAIIAERLCVELEEVLYHRDAEYYNAMKDGIFLRMAEAWLKDASSNLAQLEAIISHAVDGMV